MAYKSYDFCTFYYASLLLHIDPKTTTYTVDLITSPVLGFPRSSVDTESACSAGDPGSIPGWERSPGEGNDNQLQYSCLENPTDTGAWQATVYSVTRVGHYLAAKP